MCKTAGTFHTMGMTTGTFHTMGITTGTFHTMGITTGTFYTMVYLHTHFWFISQWYISYNGISYKTAGTFQTMSMNKFSDSQLLKAI